MLINANDEFIGWEDKFAIFIYVCVRASILCIRASSIIKYQIQMYFIYIFIFIFVYKNTVSTVSSCWWAVGKRSVWRGGVGQGGVGAGARRRALPARVWRAAEGSQRVEK